MFLTWLVKLITTEAAKRLAVTIAQELAKRTDNEIDDAAVQVVKETLGV